jgi:hypothetical protein
VHVKAGATLLILAAATAVAPAAAAAKTGSIYDVTKAKGFERVKFHGTSEADCATFGTCGYSGTVKYTIGGSPKGKVVLTRTHEGKVSARARYRTKGLTTIRTSPPGSAGDCTDSVKHRTDVFTMRSTGSNFKQLLLEYHSAGTDYLHTKCKGPDEQDVAAAGTLPRAVLPAKQFFKGVKPGFTLSGGFTFHGNGFTSTIDWKLAFKLRERACSPHCKIR